MEDNYKVGNKIFFHSELSKYGELCNFFKLKTPLIFLGNSYSTSEHLYQAMKFLYFNQSKLNLEYSELIRKSSTPYKAKYLASLWTTKRFPWQQKLLDIVNLYISKGIKLDSRWDSVKESVMEDILNLKFQTNADCKTVLLNTVGCILVEHTKTDSFWADGYDGHGKNKLGMLLMKLREKYLLDIASQPFIHTFTSSNEKGQLMISQFLSCKRFYNDIELSNNIIDEFDQEEKNNKKIRKIETT